mgnify:CR=1 FL=1|jgi:hypothetical protein
MFLLEIFILIVEWEVANDTVKQGGSFTQRTEI